MRVLYVDDDEILGRAVKRLLRRKPQVEVVYASSVPSARRVLRRDSKFDLIVSDVMMPGETGPDLHRWLTKSYPHLTQRMVFMTGGCGKTEQSYLDRAGNEIIRKPNVRRLLELVKIS